MLRYVVGWVGWVFVGLVVIFLFLDWLTGVALERLLTPTVSHEEVPEVGRSNPCNASRSSSITLFKKKADYCMLTFRFGVRTRF